MIQSDFNNASNSILANLYKWRKKLIIVTVSSAIISIIVSFLLPSQYKSTAVLYPSRAFSVSKLLIERSNSGQEDYMNIGDEDDAEKLLQLLNSNEIRLRVANKFNLWENWNIAKNSSQSNYFLNLKWHEMVSFKRTEFLSVEVIVFDYDAVRSAEIANSIVDYVDTIKFNMSKVVAKQALDIIEGEYLKTNVRIKELADSLQAIKELGVLDNGQEIYVYSRSLGKAIEKGNDKAQKVLQEKLDVLKKHGTAFDDVNAKLNNYREKFAVIKNKYDEALVNYNHVLPAKFIVEKAFVTNKSARPVKSLIVIISIVSTFIFTFLILLIAERFRLLNIKKQS